MGDVSSKELRIPSISTTGGTNKNIPRRQPRQYQAPFWYQSLFAPTKTSCDDAPLAPPPLPPAPGSPSPPPLASLAAVAAPPPPPSAEQDSISAVAEAVAAVAPNPGTYENATNDVRRLLMLDTGDGFRCEINKQLNPFMMVGHSFWLGTTMLPDGRNNNYTAVAHVGNEQGILVARVDPNRPSVDGRIICAYPFPFRLQVGVTGEGQSDQALMECDFGQQTWTANLKYGSMGGGLVWGGNYFQSITPRFSIGGEGMFIGVNNTFLSNYMLKYTMPARTGEEDSPFHPTIPGGSLSNSEAAAGTLKGSSTLWANLNLSQSMLTLSYLRVVTPQRVTLAAELQCNPLTLDSQVSLGAEFKFLRQKLTTAVDGTGRIQSILEAKLDKSPGSPTLSFSAELDHGKELTRFGYGISFES